MRVRRRPVGWCAAFAAAAVIGVSPGAARAQENPVGACVGPLALVNGGFEEPVLGGPFGLLLQKNVPGWRTTEPDERIELWQSGNRGVPAAAGRQFAELAANEPGELYQDVSTVPGTLLGYAVSHRGRDGPDTMQIQIGPPDDPPTFTRDVTTGDESWQRVLGSYRVPAGQTVTRFGFAALSSASSSTSQGNFLDGVAFGVVRCSVTLSKVLLPGADSGRFDLLLGDEAIVPAAGDGSRSQVPMPVVLDAVRVSERAVAPARLDEYASAVRCRDAVTGDVLAQASGADLLLRFDRPHFAACTVANVRAPAVVAQTVLSPPDAPGRFDLLINGRVQAAAAGDRAVAGPVALEAGERVVVSERPAAGTRASDYASAVQCRSRAGRGPVVAHALGRRVTYTAAAGQVVACVLINLRREPPSPGPGPPPQPEPEPVAEPDPVPVPAAGGAGEVELRLTARAATRRVPGDGDARLQVSVTNRGEVPATDVRIVVAVRQAGLRPESGALAITGGACARSGSAGICQVGRIEPGESVLVDGRVRSRELLAPVRLVAAVRAAEPEPVLRDNLDRAEVRVTRPAPQRCAASAGMGAALASRAAPRALSTRSPSVRGLNQRERRAQAARRCG